MNQSRRTFVWSSAFLTSAVGASIVSWADSSSLTESDPLAQSLGYRADAANVDKTRFTQYAPGSKCATCALYQGASGAASGACPIFSGKLVSAQGWCASYTKKG